jgi:hypothetical protein
MKWFILVFMLGMNPDGTKDTFLYFQPEFDTVEQCQQYVYQNSTELRNQMLIEFQGRSIEQVYCIREDKINKVLQIPKEPGKEI